VHLSGVTSFPQVWAWSGPEATRAPSSVGGGAGPGALTGEILRSPGGGHQGR
jgi:hypothetical protein